MFVPAGRRYVYDPALLVVGKEYATDSGMGGSWAIVYKGRYRDGVHAFKRLALPDWPACPREFTDEQLCSEVYICPPSESWLAERWDAERAANPAHPEGWFPANPNPAD